ncbi:hypothetical protein KP509_29G064000 [Ceratopteris richardii]|uniref:Phytocyanin domain-containing protein n=1 Tax=Ceratopteris richardii TaxID=49495 RepID=A0A8T2R9D0_CERRI|nr:hypothetical protein KP509_29G064000 [Ceratopteris richardii]
MAISQRERGKQGRGSAMVMGIALVVVCVLLAGEPASAVSFHGRRPFRPPVRIPVRLPVRKIYPVGGNGMWMLGSKVSYNKWAASKVFRQNDQLLFSFNPTFHNLMLVSAAEYVSCSPRKPIAIYRKGKVSFNLAKRETYFFICGIPGHCQAGMKMAVKVL